MLEGGRTCLSRKDSGGKESLRRGVGSYLLQTVKKGLQGWGVCVTRALIGASLTGGDMKFEGEDPIYVRSW